MPLAICRTWFLLWVRGLRGSGFRASSGRYSIRWASDTAVRLPLCAGAEGSRGWFGGSDVAYTRRVLRGQFTALKNSRSGPHIPCSADSFPCYSIPNPWRNRQIFGNYERHAVAEQRVFRCIFPDNREESGSPTTTRTAILKPLVLRQFSRAGPVPHDFAGANRLPDWERAFQNESC